MTAFPSKPGWVYILTNEALPGMVKIGLTTRTPTERAGELTAASGVPLPFVVAWARAVSDCAYVEAAVHRMLDDRRVSGKREFFRVDPQTARQVIEAAAGTKLRRRFWSRPPVRNNRRGGRYRREKDLTGFWLGLSAFAVIALLAVFQPALPGWLPRPLLRAFVEVERLQRH